MNTSVSVSARSYVAQATAMTDYSTFDDFVNGLSRDHLLSPEDLMWLAACPISSVRMGVALHEATPVPTLVRLSRDRTHTVRALVASHASLPTAIVRLMWEQERAFVREFPTLADAGSRKEAGEHRPSDVPEAVWFDACDRGLIRFGIADNPNVPADVLAELVAMESDDRVLTVVALQRNTSSATLLDIATRGDLMTRIFVASNPSADERVLRFLADDRDSSVRSAVAAHDNCPPALKRMLTAEE